LWNVSDVIILMQIKFTDMKMMDVSRMARITLILIVFVQCSAVLTVVQ